MEEEGIHLVRRYSGGGAVYQDLGNSIFTFISHRPEYCKEKNTEILVEALRRFGIEVVVYSAERSIIWKFLTLVSRLKQVEEMILPLTEEKFLDLPISSPTIKLCIMGLYWSMSIWVNSLKCCIPTKRNYGYVAVHTGQLLLTPTEQGCTECTSKSPQFG